MTWVANILFLIGIILIGRKNKWGWILEIIGEILWIKTSIDTKMWDLLCVCILFGLLQAWNFWLWHKEGNKK